MRELSPEEIREFLTSGTRTGKLAVVRKDGRPHVSPIWFDLDDDGTLVFTTWHSSVKARAMRRDPRVSICVDREEPPYDYVRVDGTAELIDDRARAGVGDAPRQPLHGGREGRGVRREERRSR